MKKSDFEVVKIIASLKEKRKVFHSEADFQFALAWEIKCLYPDVEIRLEYAYKIDNKIFHIDLLVIIDGKLIPIELKYKTSKKSLIENNEAFTLRSHSAQDCGKYDFIKDVVRIEKLLSQDNNFLKGYAIMLTNDPSYWNGNVRKNTCCAEFDIGNNKEIKGSLKWADHASVGTMKNREEPLVLLGEYRLKWNEYSCFDEMRNGKFKIVEIKVVK